MTVTEAVTASGITPSADYKGIENNVRAVVELVKNVRADLGAK